MTIKEGVCTLPIRGPQGEADKGLILPSPEKGLG